MCIDLITNTNICQEFVVVSLPKMQSNGNGDGKSEEEGMEMEVTTRRNRGLGLYGCKHYRRRAMFITPCCNEQFWCRHCHNESKYQHESDWKLKHELDRKAISEIVCALCLHRQPVGTYCNKCGVAFGAYSCTKCPFYDDDLSKKPFHCDECGICRVGGRENYFHCSVCGSCYAEDLQNNHVCVERAMHQNCPVCFEFLFESTESVTVLKCGHTIHSKCLTVSFNESNQSKSDFTIRADHLQSVSECFLYVSL